MEYKVRRESQSLMEKTFNRYAKQGRITHEMVPSLIKQMQPDIAIDSDELGNMIGICDNKGTGGLDLDGFNKIAVHFLMKQAKHDQDQFIHKHEIGPKDFTM